MQSYNILRNGCVVATIRATNAGNAMRKYCSANRINPMQAAAHGLSVQPA